MKNLHEIAYGNVSEALRKSLGLDFFHGNDFSHQFLNTRRAEPFYSVLLPLFIGEKSEVVAPQLAPASWVASTRRHHLLLEPLGRPKWA